MQPKKAPALIFCHWGGREGQTCNVGVMRLSELNKETDGWVVVRNLPLPPSLSSKANLATTFFSSPSLQTGGVLLFW